MKKYKDCDPVETIQKVRTILKDVGILVKEENYSNNVFPSCRIKIGNNNIEPLNIGSNGKGITYEYSLASAYGEFMERMQNRLFFGKKRFALESFVNSLSEDSLYAKNLIKNNLVFDFVFDYKEEIWLTSKATTDCNEILSKLLCIDIESEIETFVREDLKYKELLMIPFYSVSRQEVKLLPIELIHAGCGSNGMCAGNSFHEAILQGFCEIFERYVGREMYFNHITPPTVPIESFHNTPIYSKLQRLIEDTGYNVIIKDCSLGKGFPVFGVLIIDEQNQKYNFNLGSDFVPNIALERCLTEIYQNKSGIMWLSMDIIDLQNEKYNLSRDEYIYYNGDKIFTDSTGLWPLSLFSSKNSYEFHGFNPSLGKSNEKDFNYCIELIHNLGYEIFIRDNSITGFPTYYVFVPGMSQFPIEKKHYLLISDSFSKLKLINKLKHLNEAEINQVTSAIDENYDLLKYIGYKYTTRYLYNTNEDLIDLDVELFLFMLYYKNNQTDKAKKYLDIFLADKNLLSHKYYFALSDYIYLRFEQKTNLDEVKNILRLKYGQEAADEVIADLQNPQSVFQYYDFPNCFNCELCNVSQNCHLLDIYKLEKELDKIHISNYIEQSSLMSYFEDKR